MIPSNTARSAILGVPLDPNKQPSGSGVVRAIEQLDARVIANSAGAIIKNSLANLNSHSSPAASLMAWVIGDATMSNNGVYQNTGTSGTPVWTRRADLPFGFINAVNVGAGTANAIQVTTALPIPSADGAAEILVPIVATNTSSTVTISFNGESAIPVKTASGTNPAIGDLTNGMLAVGVIAASGGEFRLHSNLSQYANFDHQGNWDGGTTYTENQVVTGSDGSWYQLKVASALNDNPVSGGSGDWLMIRAVGGGVADDGVSTPKIVDLAVTTAKIANGAVEADKLSNDVKAGMLINAIKAAESSFAGVSLGGKAFVDLLCSSTTLDLASSTDYQFRRGGIEPSSAPGTAANAAYTALSSGSDGWTGNTIAVQVTADAIDNAAENCDFTRITWRAGTGGGLTITGAFIGVHLASSAGEFDPAFPVVPILFSGGASGSATAANTLVSDWVEYSIPPGKAIYVAFYVSAGGFAGISTATGWNTFYKSANEPAKWAKSGYTSTTTILGVEKIEYASRVYDNMTVISEELPLSSSASDCDAVAILDCDSGDVGDFALSVSRDGSTWKAVTLGALYTVNGKMARSAYGVDLTSGAGTGSALYWRAVTSNNKPIKLNSLALLQSAGTFTDVPSVDMRESDVTTTRHAAGTGLGYKPGSDVIYGCLWGFTQTHVITGPTRFRILYHAQMIHTGLPSISTPVAWAMPLAYEYAATEGALASVNQTEADGSSILNNSLKWIKLTSGNIDDTDEHYKEGFISAYFDVVEPGAYRFFIGGYSATTADDPFVPDRIALNWEEATGISVREIRYNGLEITTQPLR